MEDCIALARTLGERVGRELEIPVFLYERAATRPDRENLADVRRGEFEGIRDEIGTNAASAPPTSARRSPSDRRRRRDRRAPIPRRLQRLPRPRVQPPGREGRREGGARLVGRPALREGAGPRGRRPGAGLDESRRHREDAALPRVRHGEDGSRGARRVADVERDRRARPRARAVRRRGAPHPAARLHARAWCSSARCATPCRAASRSAASSRPSRRRRRRPAAAASRRTPARSAPRSRRWSPASPSGKKKYAAVDARDAASSRSRPRRSATRSPRSSTRDAAPYARRRPTRTSCRRSRPTQRETQAAIDAGAPRRRRRAARDGARLRRGRRARAPRSPNAATRTPSPTPASPRCSPRRRCRGAAYNVRINVVALERQVAQVRAAARTKRRQLVGAHGEQLRDAAERQRSSRSCERAHRA